MTDEDAWRRYTHHRDWFNKLYVGNLLKYNCGPCGVAPGVSDRYIIRPIYNLSGMSAGAKIETIEAGDSTKVPPGYFWCEVFSGPQYSVTYTFHHDIKPYWKPLSSWQAIRDDKNELWKFDKWVRSDYAPEVPRSFNVLSDVKVINVEFVGDNPIEVHLRDTPDPDYDEIIPIWEGEEKLIDKYEVLGYTYKKSFEDADGFIETPRLGFMVKNKGD